MPDKENTVKPLHSSAVLFVFFFSLAYWLYLAGHTQMLIFDDAIGYEQLGARIESQGFYPYYFESGPNREPLYPLLISFGMRLGKILGVPYTTVMAYFGVVILWATQVLLWRLLRKLRVCPGISMAVLVYFAVSPAITNAAFSLYSEIAAYPLVLGVVLALDWAWNNLRTERLRSWFQGMLLGFVLAAATLTKAVFECIGPLLLAAFAIACQWFRKPTRPWLRIVMVAGLFFSAPIFVYKVLNVKYSGNFAITNRAAFALYGSTFRRTQPLDTRNFLAALSYAPGEGVCQAFFDARTCEYWSFVESDLQGYTKMYRMMDQGMTLPEINQTLLDMSKHMALQHPFQYLLLMAVEASKMFFWETTQIGFVKYPGWMETLYENRIFNHGLRLLMAVLTMGAMGYLWLQMIRRRAPVTAVWLGLLVFLYIVFYAFFFILTRYALPIAALYLLAIAYSAQCVLDQRHAGKK